MFNLKGGMVLALIALSILLSTASAEEAKNELQYIEKSTKDGTLLFHMTKPGTSTFDMNVFFNDKDASATDKLFRNNLLELKNIKRAGGNLAVEKKYTVSASGGKIENITEKTNNIKFRIEDNTMLLGSREIEYKSYGSVVIIKLNKSLIDLNKFGILGIREYKLNINGKEIDVVEDDGIKSDKTKCFIIDEGIQCSSSLFDYYENNVALKVDGLFSNSIYVKKESFKLEKPLLIETEDEGATRYIKITFAKPKNLNNLNNLGATVNLTEVPASGILMNASVLSLRFDMSKLTKYDKFAAVLFKNKTDNTFSNTVYVNLEKEFVPNITKATVTSLNKEVLNFDLAGTLKGLIGETEKIKINMNGVDYSFQGDKEAIMENGKQKQDQYGNLVYSYKNKINVAKKMDGGFVFSFNIKDLLKGENIFYIKNDNTGVDSNKVSFTYGNYDKLNYKYSTGSIDPKTIENLQFENGKVIALRGIDFLNKPESNINLGKLNINNLKDYQVYKVAFDIQSNNKMNPFSYMKINSTNFQINTSSNGMVNYRFEVIGLGKDIKTGEILASLNEMYNIDPKVLTLEIGGYSIDTMSADGNFTNLFSSKNKNFASLSYNYDFGNCFDGTNDFCSLNGLKKPSMILELSFGDAQIVIAPTPAPEVSATGAVSPIKIPNADILELAFATENNKIINGKLKKLYDLIVAKGITSRQKSTLKNAVNAIVRSLKDIEDKKSKIAAATTIKASIKTIKGIVLSLKKS